MRSLSRESVLVRPPPVSTFRASVLGSLETVAVSHQLWEQGRTPQKAADIFPRDSQPWRASVPWRLALLLTRSPMRWSLGACSAMWLPPFSHKTIRRPFIGASTAPYRRRLDCSPSLAQVSQARRTGRRVGIGRCRLVRLLLTPRVWIIPSALLYDLLSCLWPSCFEKVRSWERLLENKGPS